MGQLLVLLQQLRRIAASPAVDPIDLLTALLAIVTAATPTVITTIIIQGLFPQKPRASACSRRADLPHVT
jgi:uncharacterized membrane protein